MHTIGRARWWWVVLAVVAVGSAAAPTRATAQQLGPFRQFLAIEPYYTRLELDGGSVASDRGVDGYGGRLWVNLAPFAGQHWTLISHGALAFYASYVPSRSGENVRIWHYGAQHDAFFVNRPLRGVIDPFLSVSVGAFRTDEIGGDKARLAVSPGGGIRIPIPNRLQLRIDARDAIVFKSPTGPAGASRTSHNLELQGALGITF